MGRAADRRTRAAGREQELRWRPAQRRSRRGSRCLRRRFGFPFLHDRPVTRRSWTKSSLSAGIGATRVDRAERRRRAASNGSPGRRASRSVSPMTARQSEGDFESANKPPHRLAAPTMSCAWSRPAGKDFRTRSRAAGDLRSCASQRHGIRWCLSRAVAPAPRVPARAAGNQDRSPARIRRHVRGTSRTGMPVTEVPWTG